MNRSTTTLNGRRGQAMEPPSLPDKIDVSIVIPMRDEEANVAPLCAELQSVMDEQELRYEVILINDGSIDETSRELERIAQCDPRFIVVEFARSFGQSAGLAAGFNMARGKVIVPMDGDRQNDPRDIPGLVAALDEPPGYDIVSGWRKKRQDKWLSRRLPSLLANRLVRRLTRCQVIHDFGCTLKAYRREALSEIHLYGEMHRFLPAMCRWRGARLSERVVNHRPRVAGETKYGLKRTIKVLFDLLTVKFLGDYLTKPLYFFGKLGMLTLTICFMAVTMAVVQKLGFLTEGGVPVRLNNSIFILFAMMMFITTMMLFMVGVVSELLVRIYHESQDRRPYKVRRVICATPAPPNPFPGAPGNGAQERAGAHDPGVADKLDSGLQR
jgi:glycosyltransferase involved in cell wall biosynthesis